MKQRIDYLDVAKGILMLLVILHHIPFIFINVNACHNDFFLLFSENRKFMYMPYFMTCFFLITGICCNFNKSFTVFLKKNIIQLLFPACLISAYGGWELHWFIVAMFVVRIGYWLLYHKVDKFYANKITLITLIGLLIGLLGSALNSTCPEREKFCLFHAMGLFPYLCFGHLFKDILLNKRVMLIGTITYFVTRPLLIITNTDVPYFEFSYHVFPRTFLLHTLLGISGSLFVLFLSRNVGSNKLLQYIGKWSIVILLTHTHVLRIVCKFMGAYVNYYSDDMHVSVLLFFFIFIVTLFICLSIVKLIDTKYGCYLAGKF